MSNLRRWTSEEIQTLADNASTKSAEQIGAMISRSPQSIRTKARNMGIVMRKHGIKHHNGKYPQEMIEVLLEMYLSLEVKRIAELTGLSKYTVNWLIYGRAYNA